jgi:glutathione synthase/RimK-type ligase-like ATP-grasp enzyme
VCQRIAKVSGGLIQAQHETKGVPVNAVVVNWGATLPVETTLVINPAAAVALAKDKIESRKVLEDLAPKTYFTTNTIPYGKGKVVIRPRSHHGGKKFYMKRTQEGVRAVTRGLKKGWYATELIDKAEEYRIFVLHGRIVAVSQRFPANPLDVAWNLAAGGRLVNVKFKSWPLLVAQAAIAACTRTGLDWAAVDVCVGKDSKVYVFELNTAPGLRNPYTISRLISALRWTEKHGPAKPPKNDTWQSLRHPGVKET